MPLYATRCEACRETKDVRLSFAEYDEVRAGKRSLSCSCGSPSHIEFSPGSVGFVLKDGESGGWMSKATKENGYRAKRAATMAKRENDHVFKPKLVPNYQGEETGTWKEAQEVARSKAPGGDISAATYEPLVTRELT